MRFFIVILGTITAIAAITITTFAQGGFAPAEGGSGLDISGSWHYGGHQDSAYGTAAGALVDYGGIPLNEAGRL